jgi:hypothetical protein
MLGTRHPPTRGRPVDGPDVQNPIFPLYSTPVTEDSKKIMHHCVTVLRDHLYRGSRTPLSLSFLPPAFHSTAAACSPREAVPPDCCSRLHRGHHVRPITGGSHSPTTGGSRGLHSRPSAAILHHHDCTTRSRCAVLHPPGCYVLLKAHVASVSDGCCKSRSGYCICCKVVHVCCKGLLPMFHLCFPDTCCKCVYLDVAYVSHICCMFYENVAYVCNGFQVFLKHVSSVSSAFRHMLEL